MCKWKFTRYTTVWQSCALHLHRSINIKVYIQDTGSLSQRYHRIKNHSFTLAMCTWCTRRHRLQYVLSIALAQLLVLSCQTLWSWHLEQRGSACTVSVNSSSWVCICATLNTINMHDAGPCARDRGHSVEWLALNHAVLNLQCSLSSRPFCASPGLSA